MPTETEASHDLSIAAQQGDCSLLCRRLSEVCAADRANAATGALQEFKPHRHWPIVTELPNDDARNTIKPFLESVKLLLEAGGDPNVARHDGETLLSYFCGLDGSEAVVSLLLEHGADPNMVVANGETPLTVALRFRQNATTVRLLLAHGADPNRGCLESPLMLAAAYQSAQIVLDLIEAGVIVNQLNDSGQSALSYALMFNDNAAEVVRVLLDAGAEHTQPDMHGYYPQDYGVVAASWGRESANDELSFPSGHLLLTTAAKEGEAAKLAECLGEIFPQRILTNALVMAASNGHEECCQLLMDNGADVNGVGLFHYFRPLESAATTLQVPVARLLLSRGAVVDARDSRMTTPLMAACQADNFFLIEEGKSDATSITRNRLVMVELLLGHGADVNARDNDGCTPLWYAILNGEAMEVVKLLLDRGADMEVIHSLWGITPLKFAEEFADTTLAQILSEWLKRKKISHSSDQ